MHSFPSWIQQADLALLLRLYATAGSPWIPLFQTVSDTTSALAYGMPLLLLVAGLLRQSRVLVFQALLLLAVVLLSDYSALFLKKTVMRVRPYAEYPFFHPLSDGGNSSFPSGHTTQAAALAAGLSLLFPRPDLVLTACFWALLVGFSRMYLGMHYPSDVLGAVLLSVSVACGLVLPARKRLPVKPTG